MVSIDQTAASRGIAALCSAEGQFALLLDESFRILWHTPTLTGILGYDDLVGHDGTEHLHPDDVGLVAELLVQFNDQRRNAADGGPAFRPDPADVRLRTASGGWITVEAATFDHTQNPAVEGFLITCKLIIDRSDVGRALELLGAGAPVDQVLSLVARLGDNVLGTATRCLLAWRDNDDIQVAWSPDAAEPHQSMIDATRTALRNEIACAVIVSDFDHPIFEDAAAAARLAGHTAVSIFPIITPGGTEVIGSLLAWGSHHIELGGHPQLPLQNGLRLAALAIADGRIKSVLEFNAAHDPLTTLINRAEFARRLAEPNSNIALLYVDLDDFKPINDNFGHPVGDAVLVEVARRIRDAIGESGFVGRLGGDEFAIAITGVRDVEVGLSIADQLVAVIGQAIKLGQLTVAVGASIGVALGVHPLIPNILIQRADDALLAAKHAGKNSVKLAS